MVNCGCCESTITTTIHRYLPRSGAPTGICNQLMRSLEQFAPLSSRSVISMQHSSRFYIAHSMTLPNSLISFFPSLIFTLSVT
jgi:hypothetical protein